MKHLPWAIRFFIWGPVAAVLAFSPLLITQVGQILSLVILPISRPVFRRVNTFFAGSIWGFWAWALQSVNRTQVMVSGDPLPHREDAIVIANHQAMADIVAILAVASRVGSVGHLKWLVKDIVKYVPGVGWGMMFLDCVFLKRQWAKDEQTIRSTFARIADNKLPVWLVSFPEGTRATPEKLAAMHKKFPNAVSMRYHLRPRQKGFSASVFGLREHVKAIYSMTIGYHGGPPTLLGLVRGDCYAVSVHVRRFEVASLPKDEAQLGAWLNTEFEQKDQMMDGFMARGHAAWS